MAKVTIELDLETYRRLAARAEEKGYETMDEYAYDVFTEELDR